MEENIVSSIFDDTAIEQPVPHASLGQRFVNFIIDSIVCSIAIRLVFVIIALAMAFAGVDRYDIVDLFYNPFFSVGISLLFFILTWLTIEGASKGRSLGKLITRTVVVREDRAPLTYKDVLFRTLSRLVPFEPVSIFFNLENTMWHDKWSKTMVVKKERTNY